MSQLAARLDRWQRVLPGVNPAKLAATDAQLLHADVSEGLKALITLIAELPGRYEITGHQLRSDHHTQIALDCQTHATC
jgi:hypothetical protein